MEFLKYPSLTNNFNRLELLRFGLGTQMYSTEKVDGTNISVTIDMETGEYKFGKRSGFIKDEHEKPYGDLPKLINEPSVTDIRKRAHVVFPTATVIHVYGELFGGKIQRHGYEVEGHHVILDDLIAETPTGYVRAGLTELADIVWQFMPTVLKKAELNSLIEEPLDELSQYGGYREGNVYKPIESETYPTHDSLGHFRGVKHKTDRYLEVNKVRVKKPREPMSELAVDIQRYVTTNRVMNVASHGIELDFKNFGELNKLVKADIIKEYTRDEQADLDAVTTAVNKELNKAISNAIREVIQTK